MSFTLLIIPRPEEKEHQRSLEWGDFHAKVGDLKSTAGIFCIGDNAWIFDTKKSLAAFRRVIDQAHQQGIQSYSFHLDSGLPLSLVASCSHQSEKLEKFLAS